MYCLWKTKGLTIKPWREDVIFGAVQDGNVLKISIVADRSWEGKLVFDTPRHQTIMKMPLDWPRINQFPEWFTVKSQKRYMIQNLPSGSKSSYTGKQLQEGLTIRLQANTEKLLLVK